MPGKSIKRKPKSTTTDYHWDGVLDMKSPHLPPLVDLIEYRQRARSVHMKSPHLPPLVDPIEYRQRARSVYIKRRAKQMKTVQNLYIPIN